MGRAHEVRKVAMAKTAAKKAETKAVFFLSFSNILLAFRNQIITF